MADASSAGVPLTPAMAESLGRLPDCDLSSYIRLVLTGEEVACELTVDPDKVEIITDRFGKGATFLPFDGQQVRARVKVCKSQQFFGWVASMGRAVSIAAPQSLVEEYRNYLHFLLEE